MLYEYALEPNAFKSIESFFFTINHFGPLNGRLLSEYPKGWKKDIYYNLRKVVPDGYDSTMLQARLFAPKFSPLFWRRKDCLQYDSRISWLENAKNEHARKEFSGIIINCIDESCPCRITVEEIMTEPELNEYWSLPCQSKEIARTAGSLSQYLMPLLEKARAIKFVDPFLNLKEPAFQRPILSCIIKFLESASFENYKIIEFHSSDKDNHGTKYICEGADHLWGK